MNLHDPLILDGKPRDPWAAENFQVKRSGSRYYSDTLPPCDLIPDPHTEPVPGFSSLKPSKPFRKSVTVGDVTMTVPLDAYNMGEWLKGQDFTPSDLNNPIDAKEFYLSANVARDRNFARGHAIHRAAEAVLLGKPHGETNVDAQPYLPHLIAWLEANVTDVHALEAVVFGDGYGGTGDAWLNVRGVPCYVDFKSRGVDSAHGIYEEEIAQGGAYTSARYCILPSDDRTRAVRANLPAASFGLVLSIRPDGVEEFWYTLNDARDAFDYMLNAYKATSMSGKRARAAKVKDPTSIGETAKRMPKTAAVKEFETPLKLPRIPPDEGAEVGEDVLAVLRGRYQSLPEVGRKWIGELWRESQHAHCGFHLKDNPTIRRVRLTEGLVVLASADALDDDVVKALVRHVAGEDAAMWPTISGGAAVGSLSAVDAAAFVVACEAFVAGRYIVVGGPDFTIKEVAA